GDGLYILVTELAAGGTIKDHLKTFLPTRRFPESGVVLFVMVVGQLPFDSPYFDQHRGKRLAGIISAGLHPPRFKENMAHLTPGMPSVTTRPPQRQIRSTGFECPQSDNCAEIQNRWPILQSRTAKDEQSASRLEATSSMLQIKIPGRRFLHRLLGLRDRLRRRKKSSKIFSPSEHPGPGTDGGCRQQTVAVAELRRQLLAAVDQEAAANDQHKPIDRPTNLPLDEIESLSTVNIFYNSCPLVADLRLRASRQLLRDQLMDSAERLVASGRCSQEAPRAEAELLESPAGPAPGGLLATTAQVHQGSVTAATASGRPASPNGLLIRRHGLRGWPNPRCNQMQFCDSQVDFLGKVRKIMELGRGKAPAPEAPAPERSQAEAPAPRGPAPEAPAPEAPAPEAPAPEAPAPRGASTRRPQHQRRQHQRAPATRAASTRGASTEAPAPEAPAPEAPHSATQRRPAPEAASTRGARRGAQHQRRQHQRRQPEAPAPEAPAPEAPAPEAQQPAPAPEAPAPEAPAEAARAPAAPEAPEGLSHSLSDTRRGFRQQFQIL
uniref:Protein kinase domain-containing protein n=1 Tax=Macrostomum lignano TaxID=282301 RepID=A0A1I8JR19_9PLAT